MTHPNDASEEWLQTDSPLTFLKRHPLQGSDPESRILAVARAAVVLHKMLRVNSRERGTPLGLGFLHPRCPF